MHRVQNSHDTSPQQLRHSFETAIRFGQHQFLKKLASTQPCRRCNF